MEACNQLMNLQSSIKLLDEGISSHIFYSSFLTLFSGSMAFFYTPIIDILSHYSYYSIDYCCPNSRMVVANLHDYDTTKNRQSIFVIKTSFGNATTLPN